MQARFNVSGYEAIIYHKLTCKCTCEGPVFLEVFGPKGTNLLGPGGPYGRGGGGGKSIIVCNRKRCNLIVYYIRQGQGARSKRVASSKPWQTKSSRSLILDKFVM